MRRPSGKMPCPLCEEPTSVIQTYLEGEWVRRRRRCENGHRFNTREERVSAVRVLDNDRPRVVVAPPLTYDADTLIDELRDEAKGV